MHVSLPLSLLTMVDIRSLRCLLLTISEEVGVHIIFGVCYCIVPIYIIRRTAADNVAFARKPLALARNPRQEPETAIPSPKLTRTLDDVVMRAR